MSSAGKSKSKSTSKKSSSKPLAEEAPISSSEVLATGLDIPPEPEEFGAVSDDTKHSVSEQGSSIAESARETAHEAKIRIAHAADRSQDLAKQEYERCAATIRRNPVTSVGISLLVGIAIGAAIGAQLVRQDDWHLPFRD